MKTKIFISTAALAVAVLLISSSASFAKGGGSNGRLSIGAEGAFPMGTFGDGAGTGFGGSLRYEYPMGDNLGLMLTAGYLTFGAKTSDLGPFGSYKYTNSLIPIMAGAKYYFQEQQNGFYGMAQVGLVMTSVKSEITLLGSTTSSTNSASGFGYAPGIGYHLANLDFGVSYNLFSQTSTSTVNGVSVSSTSTGSWLGIRIAYVFGEK